MNEKVKASDTISGETKVDELTAEVIAKVADGAARLGPLAMAMLPSNERMIQVVAHAIAHGRVTPEYIGMLTNVMIALMPRGISEIPVGSTMARSPLQASTEGSSFVMTSDNVIDSEGVACGIMHDESGQPLVGVVQFVQQNGRVMHVVSAMPMSDGQDFIDKLSTCIANVDEILSNKGSIQ